MQEISKLLSMRRRFLFLSAFLFCHQALCQDIVLGLPDLSLTPGAIFPHVTAEDVCKPGYARSVRHVSEGAKAAVFASYGLAGNYDGYCSGPQGCEIDHLISLELGGSNDIANLWPQPYDGEWNAHDKDRLEHYLHKLVCSGQVSLEEARDEISRDWISAYRKYLGEGSARRIEGTFTERP
jgi:hypothetical protein